MTTGHDLDRGAAVLETNEQVSNPHKRRTIQSGTVLFPAGNALALAAILLGPAR